MLVLAQTGGPTGDGSSGSSEHHIKLGDILGLIDDLLPHDVELCSKLLKHIKGNADHSKALVFVDDAEFCRFLQGFATGDTGDEPDAEHSADSSAQNTDSNPAPDKADGIIAKPINGDLNGAEPVANGKGKMPYVSAILLRWVEDHTPKETGFAEDEDEQKILPTFPPASLGSIRRRIFVAFDDGESSKVGQMISVILIATVSLSTITFLMESMPDYRERPAACQDLIDAGQPLTVEACEPQPLSVFWSIEAVCIIIFTIDYFVRIGLVHSDMIRPGKGTLDYWLRPLNMVDLFAILPFYFELCMPPGVDLAFVRTLRLLRILRLFKLAKHHPGMAMFAEVMVMSGQPLLILIFFTIIITVLFGSLIYYAEGTKYSVAPQFRNDHPTGVFVRLDAALLHDEVTPFRSIPYALWWVSVTTTTVGYGDFFPTTLMGKAIGVTCFYVGIIFLALPISVLGTNFEILYERIQIKAAKKKKRRQQQETKEQQQLEALKEKSRQDKEQNKRASREGMTVDTWLPDCDGIRKKVFFLLDDPTASWIGHKYSLVMLVIIIVSTASFIMESMPQFNHTPDKCNVDKPTVEDCQPTPEPWFFTLEVLCIVVFTSDYLCRVTTVHAVSPAQAGVKETENDPVGLKCSMWYCAEWLNLVDLFAILPFYLEILAGAGGGAAVLRVLRLVRVFRVMKMPKLRACTDMFIQVMIETLPALLILFFMTSLMCVLFASCVYFAEGTEYTVDSFKDLHPKGVYIRPTKDGYDIEPSPFSSIVYCFWWFFTSATTVGYGDDFPTSTAGRAIGILTFYTGIILLALPVTIVSQAFNKFYPAFVKEFGTQLGSSPAPKEEAVYDAGGQSALLCSCVCSTRPAHAIDTE